MKSPPPIKIILADDHTLFRKGMCEILGQYHEFKIVAEAANGKQALEQVKAHNPDIVLLDLEMPVLNGLDVLKKLYMEKYAAKSIVVSMHCNKVVVAKAMECGAKGFIHKSADIEEILLAIRKVSQNGIHITREKNIKLPQPILTQSETTGGNNVKPHMFTDKEFEILQLLREGLTSKKIAAKMFLSPLYY